MDPHQGTTLMLVLPNRKETLPSSLGSSSTNAKLDLRQTHLLKIEQLQAKFKAQLRSLKLFIGNPMLK